MPIAGASVNHAESVIDKPPGSIQGITNTAWWFKPSDLIGHHITSAYKQDTACY